MNQRRPAKPSLGKPPLLTSTYYTVGRAALRAVQFNTLRIEIIRGEAMERTGGYVLAPTHISHLEPFIISMIVRRHIDWMARTEFYQRWWMRAFLNNAGAFEVRRQGVPVSAIRTAIQRTECGRVVGIFPEGGVAIRKDSVCRGGAIKRGACLIAYRANVPVVPCVVIGTHLLNQVLPWIPFRRATLWIAFGEPIWPDRQLRPKAAREAMAITMQQAYRNLYGELLDRFSLDDQAIP